MSKNNKFKVLLLDYGGVYGFTYKPSQIIDTYSNLFGITQETINNIDNSDIDDAIAAGKINLSQYVSELQKRFKSNIIDITDFKNQLINITPLPDKNMQELVKQVKENDVKVVLVSDIMSFEKEYLDKKNAYILFDKVFCSCDIGMSKLNPDIFKKIIKDLKIDPSEILLVDDRDYCIDSAKKAGLTNYILVNQNITNSKKLSKLIKDTLFKR